MKATLSEERKALIMGAEQKGRRVVGHRASLTTFRLPLTVQRGCLITTLELEQPECNYIFNGKWWFKLVAEMTGNYQPGDLRVHFHEEKHQQYVMTDMGWVMMGSEEDEIIGLDKREPITFLADLMEL